MAHCWQLVKDFQARLMHQTVVLLTLTLGLYAVIENVC
jgi:hypothetical protein